MSTSRIVELAELIRSNTVQYEDYLRANNFASPSFDPDVKQDYIISDQAEGTKVVLMEAIEELHRLLLGPHGILMHDPLHMADPLSLQVIADSGMGKALKGDKEEATYDEIAKHCGLSEPTTRRIIRHGMTRRLFQEKRPGFVSHTAASKLLTEDELVRSGMLGIMKTVWVNAPRLPDALVKWGDSQESTETAHNLGRGTDAPFWDWLGQNPVLAQQFANAMKLFTKGDRFASHHLVEQFAWDTLGEGATVVDIGGSHGVHMAAVLEKHKHLRCIVQDRPEIISEVSVDALPPTVKDRMEFMAHDFLTEQPIKGADIYFYRWILHDWSDKYCKKILSSLIPAFRPGSRIVLMDLVLPEPNMVPKTIENQMRSFDIIMWTEFNGKEREERDWRNLFRDTDPRFKFVSATQSPSSALGIIEAIWEP